MGICLPDEINLLRLQDSRGEAEPRRLIPAGDDALPLYVQIGGGRVGKSGDELVIEPRGEPKRTARLAQTSQVSLFGNVQMSTQAIQAVVGRRIPICYFSAGGWFYGMTVGSLNKNVELRRLQAGLHLENTAVAEAIALLGRFLCGEIPEYPGF